MALQSTRRRFTASEYHQMVRAGILAEDDRVELIAGEIVEMTPIGPRHASTVVRLTRLFEREFGDSAIVSVQNPIRLGEETEPQPDVMLLGPRSDFYATGHPRAEDVLLLVEVGETSSSADRQIKLPLYASNGIREVWLVDLQQETVMICRDPAASEYSTIQVVSSGEQLAPLAFSDRELAVQDILG